MRKLLLTMALVTVAFTAEAQQFKVGLGGGVNSTWLLNKNISDQGEAIDYATTFGGAFGLKTQYFFNEKMGIELGILYSGHNQKYETNEEGFGLEVKTKLSYVDIPVLFHYGSGKGFYFEIGPQFSFLTGAKDEDLAFSFGGVNIPLETTDVKDSFNKTNVALVLGAGMDIPVSDFLTVTAGLRFGYGFTDVTKDYTNDLITNDELSLSITTLEAHYNSDRDLDYKPTKRIFGGIHVGVLYHLPF